MRMKNIFKTLAALALIFALAPVFASCGNDDEEELIVTVISGNYSGTLDAKVMGTPCDMPGDYQVSIQKEPKEKDEVQVVLPQCSFSVGQMGGSKTIPSLTIPEVNVKKSGAGYHISNDYKVTVDGVAYTGTISGDVKDKKADIFYTIQPGHMPMTISFTFNGAIK